MTLSKKRKSSEDSIIKTDDTSAYTSDNIEVETTSNLARGDSSIAKKESTKVEKEPKDHVCRFCNMVFTKSQALGGHMNKHRAEKEEEGLKKAQHLVDSKQQMYGGLSWSNHGRGALMFGQQNVSTNVATGMPYLQSPANIQTQFQMNQLAGYQGSGNVTATGHHEMQHAHWVNSGQLRAQMAYPQLKPGLHGGTDVGQAGPSQSLHDMASNYPQAQHSNVQGMMMAPSRAMSTSYAPPFPQEQSYHVQFGDHVALPSHPPIYRFTEAHEYAQQTSIDERSESLRHHSVGSETEPMQSTGSHHHTLPQGMDHGGNPLVESGGETSSPKTGGGDHSTIF